MFLDEAIIEVTGGAGGRGCVSWRREKFVPMGGPDGGNGGKGGDIVIMADENTDTLSNFASTKRFEAEKGRFGSGKNMAGRAAEDRILHVPPGTLVWELPSDDIDDSPSEPRLIADLAHHGDRIVVANGGRGGYGNSHFVSSTRQHPEFAELGEPGEHRLIKLELKLVADVGIIGFPSVGKSTLISVISAARPKIAAYPFTTLIPNLGVVTVGDRSYVVSDLPGLIEGASEGKGLGDKFLKHIERCGVLLHVLDVSHALGLENELDPQKLVDDYQTIRKELANYSPTLSAKRELVILNKTDLIPGRIDELLKPLKKAKIDVFMTISAATVQGTKELTNALLPIVLEERTKREKVAEEEEEDAAKVLPVLRPQDDDRRMGAYRIEDGPEGSLIVRGKRLEQFTKMTDFKNRGAVERFRDVVERIGLMRALIRQGWQDEVPVYIGTVRVDEHL
jgi:GTPase